MNLKYFNSLLFSLLPLTFYGYQIGKFLPLMGGCFIFVLVEKAPLENTFFRRILFATLAVLGLFITLIGDVVISVNQINFSIDPFFVIIGFGLAFSYNWVASVNRQYEGRTTIVAETASITIIHFFFLLFPKITRHIASFSRNEILIMAMNLSVSVIFFSGLAIFHKKTCSTFRKYKLVRLGHAHDTETPSMNESEISPAGGLSVPGNPSDSSESMIGFTDPFLIQKWEQMVVPCLARLQELRMDRVTLEIFSIYDSVGRDVPSVYGLDNSATRYSDRDYELLLQVTLADHSFRVAELALTKIKYRYQETWEYLWPQQLIISLGHDISKIPHLASGYSTKDHGVNSANFMASVFRQHAPELKRELIDPMLDAIRDHHKKFDDNRWTPNPSEKLKLLMECDKEAREIEKDSTRASLIAVHNAPHHEKTDSKKQENKNYLPDNIRINRDDNENIPLVDEKNHSHLQPENKNNRNIESTLDDDIVGCEYEEFIKPGRGDLEPSTVHIRDLNDTFVQEVIDYLKKNYLNRVVNKAFYAVSQKDGFVYCWTDIIYDLIQIVAEKRNSQSAFLFMEKYKYSVLLSFYRNLKSKGFVPADDVVNSERYFANTFTFFNPKKKEESSGFYMLIAAEAFGEKTQKLEEQRFDEPELAHITMKLKTKKARG